jgi:GNAT superfamily N-acetyltransferase
MTNSETPPSRSREASRSELPALCDCLSRAFEDDPISVFLFPHERSRTRRLAGFYRLVLPILAGHGAIYTEPELRGAAAWQAPSPPRPGLIGGFLGALALVASLRTASRRAQQLSRVVMRSHPRKPHWYLGILGTNPGDQGQGIGSTLMEPVLARCDAEALPAYLESSKRENIPFYERHGFRVTGELRIDGGPALWPMLRSPATRPSHAGSDS